MRPIVQIDISKVRAVPVAEAGPCEVLPFTGIEPSCTHRPASRPFPHPELQLWPQSSASLAPDTSSPSAPLNLAATAASRPRPSNRVAPLPTTKPYAYVIPWHRRVWFLILRCLPWWICEPVPQMIFAYLAFATAVFAVGYLAAFLFAVASKGLLLGIMLGVVLPLWMLASCLALRRDTEVALAMVIAGVQVVALMFLAGGLARQSRAALGRVPQPRSDPAGAMWKPALALGGLERYHVPLDPLLPQAQQAGEVAGGRPIEAPRRRDRPATERSGWNIHLRGRPRGGAAGPVHAPFVQRRSVVCRANRHWQEQSGVLRCGGPRLLR